MADRPLEISLLLIRVSLFVALLMWTVDKFINPVHAAHIFESFYGVGGVGIWAVWLLGTIELLILLAFVIGYARTFSYGFVVVVHGLFTVVSLGRYLTPFDGTNLLFFAAWPMWAAAVALFLLRDSDRLLSVGRPLENNASAHERK